MPLQSLYLEADSLRVGANQFLTQANAVYVGNNLHVGNTLILGLGAGNNQWPTIVYPGSTKLLITANNPLWSGVGGGAIDLRVGQPGGRVGVTFSSNTNWGSDGAYIYYNDTLPGYTSLPGGETSVFLIGTWNDSSSSPSNEDVLAIEGPGNIFINPGMGTSITPGGTTSWSNTQGNLYVGNNSVKYLSIHEGLQAPVTLRAPITFANSANALTFSGASNTSITLRTNPNGILSFDGGAGSLLAISNNITGQIFSVNDISGFPIVEAFSNTLVQMGQYGGRVAIGSNTTPSSRFQVTGNTTVTAMTIEQGFGAQHYLSLPGAVTFRSNGNGELDVLGLGELRFTNSTTFDYDVWGGIKWVAANTSMFIGGPAAPFNNNGAATNAANINFVGVSNFAISNTSVTKMYVAANGNVGIGNTTPASKLRVEGTASITSDLAVGGNLAVTGTTTWSNTITWNNGVNINVAGESSFDMATGGQWGVWDAAASTFAIRANNANNVILVENGKNVGIGNTTPNAKLQVTGTANVSGNVTIADNVLFVDATNRRVSVGELGGRDLNVIGNTSASVVGIQLKANNSSGTFAITASSTQLEIKDDGDAAPSFIIDKSSNVFTFSGGNVSFTNSVSISGNLTVSGTTTYINTTNLNIGDNIISLNADLGASAPSENAGISVNRGTSANVAILWDESIDRWVATNDGTTYANIAIGAAGATLVANTTDTATYYLPMSNTTSGSWSNAVVDTSLFYVPSTSVLSHGNSTVNVAISTIQMAIWNGGTKYAFYRVGSAYFGDFTSYANADYSATGLTLRDVDGSYGTMSANTLSIGNTTVNVVANSTALTLSVGSNTVIISSNGAIKFADGTIQTTAAISPIAMAIALG